MNEKESNIYKFSLTQGNVLLCEKMIDANQFNPFTRYSINIKEFLRDVAIPNLQKVLSEKNYDVILEVGRKDITITDSENYDYDLYEYYLNLVGSYPKRYRDDIIYNPQSITQKIDGKIIKGVECKIGFSINNKPIVERLFYVNGYNPIARWSVELINTVSWITDSIFDKIKKDDIKNMWDDYSLINVKGYTINQIREFPIGKRIEILKSMKN